jgi:effector-binding domain-containing protein
MTMLKIGDFSKLSQVPIKTLRYYDRIGLLPPAEVDAFTGYRYYAITQLARLNRILALKDLGFSLEQIATVLTESLSAEELRGMLRMKQAEVQTLIAAEQERLARIQARITYIEQEHTMPNYEIVIKKAEPFQAATLRDVIPTYDSIGRLYAELANVMREGGLHPTGPCAAIYYDEGYQEEDVDVEVLYPVAGDLPPHQRVSVRTIKGVEQVAALVHNGPYEGFQKAYQALIGWIEDNGYAICGPNREIYLQDATDGRPPEDYVTEIQFPVRTR